MTSTTEGVADGHTPHPPARPWVLAGRFNRSRSHDHCRVLVAAALTGRPWAWWALVALAAAVLIVPTIAIITLRERAAGVIWLTVFAGIFLAEPLDRKLT